MNIQPGKYGPLLPAAIILILLAVACTSIPPSPDPAHTDQLQPPSGTAQAPAPEPEPEKPASAVAPALEPQIQIKLVHHRGTLTRIGCCNPGLYERDEFVVIQNTGETNVDITDWRLTNTTRGYPTFIFPSHFPCLPHEVAQPSVTGEASATDSYYTLAQNPAQSEANRFSTASQQSKPVNVPNGDVSWSSCTPLEPLDETPMSPAAGQQGLPRPCILYPGQTILVFTDEVHCQTGGFSFNWGLGNIWNNEIADTAVLYNAAGEEVSRRSYLVGR